MKNVIRIIGFITALSFAGAYAISKKTELSNNDIKNYRAFENLADLVQDMFGGEKVPVDQVNIAALKKLKIQVSRGSIKMRNGEGSEIRVTKAVPKSLAEKKQPLGKLHSKIKSDEVTLSVSEESEIDLKQEIEVLIPKAVQEVIIETASADIDAKDLQADVIKFLSASGDLRARHLKFASFDFNTQSGDTIAYDMQGKIIELRSVSGDVILSDFSGEQIQIASTSGDLVIKPKTGEHFVIEAKSVTGNVVNQLVYQGEGNKRLSAQSISGDIHFQ